MNMKNSKNKKLNKKKENTMSKKKIGIFTAIASAVLCVVIAVSVICSVLLKKPKDNLYVIPALDLPIEERYALQKYKFENMSEVVSTIRADTMVVTRRNLKRAETKPMSDIYTLSSNASINFKDYPTPKHGFSGNSSALYLTEAKAMFPSDTDAVALQKYGYYYKYMLMSQGYNAAIDMQELSKQLFNGSKEDFEKELYKHPAADAQYGEVVGTDNAVEKVIILDSIYRAYHATGLYMPAGECVTVKVEGLEPGESISMVIGLQNSLAWRGEAPNTGANTTTKDKFFFDADNITSQGDFGEDGYFQYNSEGALVGHKFLQGQWARQNGRLPWLTAEFTFNKNGTYYIGTPFGGIMHINPRNCYSNVKTTITGAVETPHYILGVTTPEYFDTYLRNAPGVVGVMDTENGQLIGMSKYMRGIKTEEIDKLGMLWHSFFSVNESFTGGTYNRFNKVMFDWHVPAGLAVALGNYSYACPESWFGTAMNYRSLLSSGQWGILHEVGHSHGSSFGSIWGFGGGQEGEVRNNALTLLSYILFCDVGTTVRNGGGAEHGAYANPYNTLTETLNLKDRKTEFSQYGYFETLGMYANIMHSFGAEKYYELLYSYKLKPNYIKINTNGLSENEVIMKNTIAKRADFAYRCSTVYGMNFIRYFNTYYCAKITDDYFSSEQLAFMKSLPNYEPVSSFYAGGIDGVKTAGDYKVTFGSDIVFDLKGKTISTLPFEIISVGKPTHGKIVKNENGTYTYSFNQKYFGSFDEFTFRVKLEDGVCHDLTVYLRISYDAQGGKLYIYDNVTNQGGSRIQNWDALIEEMKNQTPRIEAVCGSKIPTYTTPTGQWEARVLDFYWTAPKTGKIYLAAKGDDSIRVYFGDSFETLGNNIIQYSGYYDRYDINNVTKDVVAGTTYCIRLFNINTGGEGSASVGIRYDGESYRDVPKDQIQSPLYPLGFQAIEDFVFEPNYMVSKKDNIKVSSGGTDKSEWKVVEAPDDKYIRDGRYEEVERVELLTDENGNLTGETNRYFVSIDKWSYLIDGDVGTMFHTQYGDDSIKYPTAEEPYVFVIDTNRVQQFNYFQITTRANNTGISKIVSYELLISSDGINYTTIVSGDKLEYKSNVARLEFTSTTGRYLKLLVKSTTGNNKQFVVINEIDAGITSKTQRIVPATSSMIFATKGWIDTSTIDEEQNGFMLSTKRNQKLVYRFEGKKMTMYAAVGQNFGKADVKIDGKYIQTLDFNSSIYESRKLMLNFEDLEDKIHTVEIITKSSGRVMINMFGMGYTAELINAPNIYLERALTISLVVFILLFVVALALLICLLFIPKFRKFMGNNKAINALDKAIENGKEKRKIKKAEKKEELRKQKEIDDVINGKEKVDMSKNTKTSSKPKTESVKKVEEKKQNSSVKSSSMSKNDSKLVSSKTSSVKVDANKKATSGKPVASGKNVVSNQKPATKPASVASKSTPAKAVKQPAKTSVSVENKTKSTSQAKPASKSKPALPVKSASKKK